MSRFEFHMQSSVNDELSEQDDWTEVTGGGLDQPILIRVGKGQDGRPVVTGLILGNWQAREISADTLRKIRLGAILEQLFEGFDPEEPPGWGIENLDDQIEWGLMHETLWQPAKSVEGRPGRGPDDETLRRFSETYKRAVVTNRNRAMAATASEMRIGVATAHRWANLCRQRGYLPPKQPRA